MTQREFFNAVIAETENADLAKFAVESLQKLDARNAKRASTPSKTAIANEPIKQAIMAELTDTPQTAAEIAVKVGVTTQKASALLRQIDCEVTEVKVPKKGKQKGYFVAVTE